MARLENNVSDYAGFISLESEQQDFEVKQKFTQLRRCGTAKANAAL